MSRSDDDRARADERLATLGCDELVALVAALELRVRGGTATLADFGALARSRRELEGRADEAAAAEGSRA